jgi:predicted nucleic acid-binding protein
MVWYFTSDQRLGKVAYETLEASEEKNEILIPTIVLAEILYISKRERIKLSFKDTLGKIETNDNYTIVPLDIDMLIQADKIESMLEMHDKLIVATAILYDAA